MVQEVQDALEYNERCSNEGVNMMYMDQNRQTKMAVICQAAAGWDTVDVNIVVTDSIQSLRHV